MAKACLVEYTNPVSKNSLSSLDTYIIGNMRKAFLPSARFALFIVFAWFGALKVFGLSPATPLVEALHSQLIPFIPFDQFYMAFGVYEVVIGLTFIIKGFERAAIALLFPHMISTALPLVFTPDMVWQGWFVPTLEGQYIIKNTVLVSAAIGIASQLTPIRRSKNKKEEAEKKK